MKLRFTEESLRYMLLFEAALNLSPNDCVVFEDVVYFIIPEGQLRNILRNRSENLRWLKNNLKKNILLVEYSSDPNKFIRNLFGKINVKRVEIIKKEDKIVAVKVYIDPKDVPLAIGKDGKNLNRIREIVKRYYEVSNVVILQSVGGEKHEAVRENIL